MVDIQQLIQKIVSDPKIAANSNFASKVYRDEPILITAPQLEKYTPPKIREMRKLARGNASAAKTFYEQGKFMESFADDFVYRGEFYQYFPTYQAMNDAQLRGYFSWRSKVRRGTVEKTSLSFVFVYIYELLNQIGVQSPEEGFHVLKDFWLAYKEIDSRINSYVTIWLRDYAVYHNLDKSLLDGLADITFDNAVTILLDYQSYGIEEVFIALNSLSSYNLRDSRFYKQYPDDVMTVAYKVFSIISDYYNRSSGKNAREKLFGRVSVNTYSMFRSAVFHQRAFPKNLVYEIGNYHKYICQDGEWSCERFIWYGHNNKRIGALLKTVDYLMRQSYGYKSTLQPGKTNKVLRAKIEKAIAAFEQEKKANALPIIAIDVSRLQQIRAASLTTRGKLLVEDPEEEEPPPVVEEQPRPEHVMGLSDMEYRFLRHLLYDGKQKAPFQANGLMLSVLIDGINEKLFDMFNDTVIGYEGDEPALIEDYKADLKGMIAS